MPTWPLIRRGLRKGRAEHLVTVVLVMLGAAMLHLGLVLGIAYPSDTEQNFDRLQAEDVLAVINSPELAVEAAQFLAADPDVTSVDVQPVRSIAATLMGYRGGDVTTYALFHDLDRPPTIGMSVGIDRHPVRFDDGIYVPLQLVQSGGYTLGGPVSIQIGPQTSTFHVQGTIETPMSGSLLLGTVGFAMQHEQYERFVAQTRATPSWVVRAQVRDGVEPSVVGGRLTQHVQAEAGGDSLSLVPFSNTSDVMKPSLLLPGSLFSAMLIVFTLIVAGVVAVVITHQVRTAVIRDLSAIGTLKATGFTSAQVLRSFAGQHVLTAAVGAMLGVVVGQAALPALAQAMTAQTGLRWTPGFEPLPAVLTVLVMIGAAALASGISALRVRKLAPVDALRGGSSDQNAVRNHFPLDRTRGGIDWVLGLKQASRRPAQGFMLALVAALLAFTTVFCVGSYRYMNDPVAMYDVSLGDWGDIWAAPLPGVDHETLRQQVAAMPGVERAYYDDMMLQANTPHGAVVVRATPDYSVLRYDSVIEGRAPRAADEVAVGVTLQRENDLGIGDQLEVRYAGRSASYRITGVVQTGFGLGRALSLTTAGYERLEPGFQPMALRVKLEPGADLDATITAIRQHQGVLAALDSEVYRASMLGPTRDLMQGLAALFVVICALLVVLVVGLVSAGAVLQGRREAGIKKALGFSNRQLSTQLVASQLPQVVLGVVVGVLVGWATTAPLVSVVGRSSGQGKVPVDIPVSMLVAVGVALVSLTVLTMTMLARRLRRVSAHALITE
ncbi:FtsX-like permease family protein [Aestuariimicrobium ganziense]|uniref:FtsX-like permease family protein n=1 Tax=Aestuariimicrobium ganziense TaxID=2773677 RepID=UPI0019434C0F|nr:ABC transporter permease [Aestuariimicrobium ganziense]